jgi:thiosulfate reductase cytochrome b subunit
MWAFTIFWQFTTGEWRQYLPVAEKRVAMVHYYTIGIFTHSPHPFRKTVVQKHNPLQRLAYLAARVHLAADLGLRPALPVLRQLGAARHRQDT